MARILIVDDEQSIRRTLGEFLRADGHEVVEAEDADTAFQRLKETEFDVVVTDIVLPRVTGVDLLRHIHATAPYVQVVMMTGEPTVETASESLRAGASDYLFKPVSKSAILRVVGNAAKLKTLDDTKRRLEADNRRHRENLERLVDERTRQLQHLNQLLQAIRNINKLIVHERVPQQLLTEACNILVKTRGYLLVWIGCPEEGSKRVLPVARAGRRLDYLDSVILTCDESPTGQGPVGTALRTRQPWACQDTATDPRFEPWRGPALERGFASMAALPLLHGSRLFGAINVYADHAAAFDPEEIGLLEELARDLAFALQSIEDETARRHAEEQIRAQARLLDLAQDAIVVRDMEDRVRYWNQGATKLYGWNADEAYGRKVTELFWQDAEAFRKTQGQLLLVGQWAGEICQRTKDRQAIMTSSRWTLVRDARGQPELVLAINTDVTEQRRIEAQFLRAQRLEGLGALAGGIAHDLNNILAPMLLIVPLMRDMVSDVEGRAMLASIETCARRGTDIIKQLLTYARGAPGARVPLPVQHLLREMDQIIRETFPRDIRPVLHSPKDLWLLLGDPTQLHQALMNLCVNARDAMPEGGTLTLGARNVTVDETFAVMSPGAKPGPYVCVCVADTGTGIAPENLDRIFDPFFTTKEIGKGTGLGLATVLGIVRGHKGFERVDSRPGHGTTFELYFPASPHTQAPPAASAEAAPQRRQDELILVVDDEAPVRNLLRRTLETHGYRVVTAAQGAEGLAAFYEHRAEVRAVLTDMMMPGINGPAMIAALRLAEPRLTILGMTGLLERTGVKGLEQLDIPLLTKPFSGDEVLRALHAALEPPGAAPPKGAE
jgi:PAS domain S-box-containing protein